MKITIDTETNIINVDEHELNFVEIEVALNNLFGNDLWKEYKFTSKKEVNWNLSNYPVTQPYNPIQNTPYYGNGEWNGNVVVGTGTGIGIANTTTDLNAKVSDSITYATGMDSTYTNDYKLQPGIDNICGEVNINNNQDPLGWLDFKAT